jgi:hypothetical protein
MKRREFITLFGGVAVDGAKQTDIRVHANAALAQVSATGR